MKEPIFHWYAHYLQMLKSEITSYKSEEVLWQTSGDIQNSGGNLCVHLIGNLNYFIGAVLGKTGYLRQRDLEFSIKNVPRSKMIQQIEDTEAMIRKVFDSIEDWEADYPPNDYHSTDSIHYQMIRMLAHLGYHVGQVNYHRRLMDV